MRAYQLDECTNSAKLNKQCAKEGKADLRRFPGSMRGQSDASVLNWIAPQEAPLITTDIALKDMHEADFPESHPGIVVIASGRSHGLSTRLKLKILENFKSRFRDWDSASLRNSIIEIWEQEEFDICVSRARQGRVSHSMHLRYADENWETMLRDALIANASDNPNT